jgi:hypothetical protein
MNDSLPCEALTSGRTLEVIYAGYTRVVEVHAVGATKDGNVIMRVWQLRGGSVGGSTSGWKLLRLDEISSSQITEELSAAPRTGYRHNDPAMTRIICQL